MQRTLIRFLASGLFILTFLAGVSLAQTPQTNGAASKPAPTITQPTGEQQKALRELFIAADKATSEAQAAQRTAESLRQKFFSELYRVMAELGLKPSEHSLSFADNGEVKFEKRQESKAGNKPQEAKP